MVDTYNPKKVLMTWGEVLFTGFADGTMIEAARNNQSVNLAIGSTGDGARAISNDHSGIVTATLLQTAIINGLLSAALILDEETGDGVKPLQIKTIGGLDVIFAESAWIQKPASATYAREIESREWVFETDNLNIFMGGIP